MLAVSFVCVYAVVLHPLYTISLPQSQRYFYPQDFQRSKMKRCIFSTKQNTLRVEGCLVSSLNVVGNGLISLVQL